MLEHLRILVVDDEPDLCEIVRRVLSRAGAEVLTASGLAGAERLCAEHPKGIDLAITDLKLDDGSGVQVAGTVRATCPDAMIMYMSGLPYFDAAVVELGPEASVIAKPFRATELVDMVRLALVRAGRVAPER
ncbi:response regulator [Dactylosporangium roseum]|uniref:Response regulator n=1 Tax=Dactylosporangium roseum TaxID=47989 RepID=A0ABY5ZE63_9ACTN|nr:response regulator [Dactylosporangium roseum]UWZ38594.1 response regulator [Dactylosporangium roseum]